MRVWRQLGLLTAVLVVLSACGYKPLYPNAKQNVSNVHVASVTMSQIENKPGARRAAQPSEAAPCARASLKGALRPIDCLAAAATFARFSSPR